LVEVWRAKWFSRARKRRATTSGQAGREREDEWQLLIYHKNAFPSLSQPDLVLPLGLGGSLALLSLARSLALFGLF